jgi:hypothetical protein
MNTEPTPLAADAPRPTQHGLLVCWGHFAQELGLLEHLQAVPIPQKTVIHSPAAKLTTLFMGLLSGIEHLTDLTHAPAPLYHDPTLAAAWGLPALPEASGVSRTLTAATPQSLAALQTVLTRLTQPFLERALQDLRLRSQPLVLDVDLTGQPVSAASTSFPNAAFGYMDGEIRLGYQLAVVCLHTELYGRQWLVGEQHPGNTVSAPCLLGLLATAEERLGGHPRRRPELLDPRIAALQEEAAAATTQVEAASRQRAALLAERRTLQDELRRTLRLVCALRQTGDPSPALGRAEAALAQGQARLARLRAQTVQLARQQCLAEETARRAAAELTPLVARRAALAAENAAQPEGPRIVLRMDAGFSSGTNLRAVLELGYEVETKSANPALVAALLARLPAQTGWTPVGQNAAMVGFTNYTLSTCPYPLTVGLERFQTADGPKYAVLLRSEAEPSSDCPDLRAWFKRYNERGDIEAGIKQGKTVFHVQHLWSRQRIGMQIQIALTLFAANFVQWAAAWLGERLVARPGQWAAALQSVKRAVRSAANAPALVEGVGAALVVRFSPCSSWAGLVVGLGGPAAIQMELPLWAACGWGSSG